MARLITETSYDFEIAESKSSGMYIAGIFSSAEIENNNKRKYRKGILEREVVNVSEKTKKGSLWGELGHPPNPEINPDKIAILVTELEWKGNDLYGKAKLLDTPMGNIAKTLVKEGKMGISSRGLGTVSDDGYVNEDFKLITWDLVTDPSNNPSWVNGIYEGKEFYTEEKVQKPTLDDAVKYHKKHIMDVLENIEKTFNISSINEINASDDVMGLKMWLDDLDSMIKYGNIKDAKSTISRIVNVLNKIKKSL